MNTVPLLAVACLMCVVAVVQKCAADVPSGIQKCRAADMPCITETINEILRKYPNGNEELGLRNLEPVHLDELVVAKAHGNHPLNLDLKFINLDVYGLSKTNVTRVVGFEKDPRKAKIEVHVTIPQLTLRGQYETNGRILLLPMVGKGDAEIQLRNLKSGVKVKVTTSEENGKQYIRITKMKVLNELGLLRVRFDNLFNGNKALGDEINNVINQNWKDVWSELETGINDGYAEIVKFVINDVLKTVSYDDFYSN